MASPVNHVHIGAGRLGLGMVVDLCSRAGMSSIVLHRKTSNKHVAALLQTQRYTVQYDGGDGANEIRVPVKEYASSTDETVIQLLASPSVRLLTVSVRPQNLASIAPFLSEVALLRGQANAPPLVILACENLRNNGSIFRELVGKELPPGAQKHLVFCNTLVDRICPWVRVEGGEVFVAAESPHEWIIEASGDANEALSALKDSRLATIVESPALFELYETRKFWCLNGVQLAAAAFAYQKNEVSDTLANALQDTDTYAALRALQSEAGLALRSLAQRRGFGSHPDFSTAAIQAFSSIVAKRLVANESDTVSRLLRHETDANELAIHRHLSELKGLFARDQGRSDDQWASIVRSIRAILESTDLQDFLSKVIIRLVEPRRELLGVLTEAGRRRERLHLDDAISSVMVAVERTSRLPLEIFRRTVDKLEAASN